MPNAYFIHFWKLTLRVSLLAQGAKHSARRPGLGAPKAFKMKKRYFNAALTTTTLRKLHQYLYLPIESKKYQ